MKFFKFLRKYKVYLIIIAVLGIGVFYKRNIESKNSDLNNKTEIVEPIKKTMMIHTGLHNKSPEEKRKYLLDNFDLDYVIKNDNAKITIIEYLSFTCRFCKKMRDDMNKIIEEYVLDGDKQITYVIRPLYNTKNIPIGAFLLCAKDENKLEIINYLLKNDVDKINDMGKFLIEIGNEYNMDEDYVKNCIYNKENYEKLIYMQQAYRSAFNLEATPVLVINGREIVGYKNYKQLKDIIDNILKGNKNG